MSYSSIFLCGLILCSSSFQPSSAQEDQPAEKKEVKSVAYYYNQVLKFQYQAHSLMLGVKDRKSALEAIPVFREFDAKSRIYYQIVRKGPTRPATPDELQELAKNLIRVQDLVQNSPIAFNPLRTSIRPDYQKFLSHVGPMEYVFTLVEADQDAFNTLVEKSREKQNEQRKRSQP